MSKSIKRMAKRDHICTRCGQDITAGSEYLELANFGEKSEKVHIKCTREKRA